MKYFTSQNATIVWLLLFTIAISGCSALIDKYDQVAYQNATSLKVESLTLMDKAIAPYSDNETAIDALKMKIYKAYEYAKGKPKNEIVTKQWERMKDPAYNLLGGFLARWKNQDSFSETFISEAKKNISLGFDQIIGLESGKIKSKGSE